ncbi:MAG: glutamine--fructose-6-phosphate transaminase (isomerizing) [Planctomycetota bacterium]|jgi:glucosamine--fructose-6-phosphate aminotransferase (isomerizing)|nr:glutamine--fructose-6-phosphate transaminase (isomerizing) [Planctomycetota bacterium]
MCGIAGYVGPKGAESILTVALERLKYRGYDSAGLCIVNDGDLLLRRAAGRLRELEHELADHPISGNCGIAHTRWATHGAPTSENAHPHKDGDNTVAVVHNGIIENHEQLRRALEADGAVFNSDTDTEVIPHLLARAYQGDPVAAVREILPKLEGSYAFAAVFADQPGRIVAARHGSPLLLGRGKGESLIASDIPALLPHAHEYCPMEDGWVVDCTGQRIVVCSADGTPVEAEFKPIEVEITEVSMGDYDSFMAKEIAEQPEILQRLLDSRLRNGDLVEPDLGIDLKTINHVVFLACGTSWHAAMLGKRFLEHYARVHVEVDISSEYRYRNPVASGDTLVVPISQSGETADTLAGLRLARSMFMPVVSLVNVMDSTIARESDGVLPLMAGPEIGVASTKAYTAQIMALYLFALQVARAKGRLDQERLNAAILALKAIPEQVTETLALCEEVVEHTADLFAPASASVFLGRGGEHVTALEGALKLKEIAYVFATGYAAGEFKHGPIALVTQHLPLVCLCPRDAMHDKMLSNIQEVRARSGRVVGVGAPDDQALADLCDFVFPVVQPQEELLQPLLTILPLQRYAYHVARKRDCDVDQPRNLAKSVTVE